MLKRCKKPSWNNCYVVIFHLNPAMNKGQDKYKNIQS